MKKASKVAPAAITTAGSKRRRQTKQSSLGSKAGQTSNTAEGSKEEQTSMTGTKVGYAPTDAEGPSIELAEADMKGSKFEYATTDAKGFKGEEGARKEAEGATAHICPSFRLLVWLVLSLGCALASMEVSTLSVALSCRSLYMNGTRSESINLTRQRPIMREPTLARGNSSLSGRNPTGGEGKQTRSGSRAINSSTVTESVNSRMESPRSSTVSDKPSAGSFRGERAWSKMTEALIIIGMLIGENIFQVPSGLLSVYVGARRVSIAATCVCIVTQALSVPAMYWGPVATGIVFFVKGSASGALFPALILLASKWCGSMETSMVISVVGTGFQIGHSASYLAGFFFCHDGEGWTKVLYQEFVVGILFGLALCLLVQEKVTPESRIACLPAAERQFLTAALQVKGISSEKMKVPYRSILTSLPVIALIVYKAGTEWLQCLMVLSLPQSLSNIQGIDIGTMHLFTCVGLLLSIPFSLVGARVADSMMASPRFHPSTVRKLFSILNSGFPALCFLVLVLLDSRDEVLVMTLYLTGIGFTGLVACTWPANCLDLAPAFAGLLSSLADALTAWLCITCVIATAHMAPHDTAEEWRSVLYLAFGILFTSTIFYVLFASGERQAWGDPQPPSPRSVQDE